MCTSQYFYGFFSPGLSCWVCIKMYKMWCKFQPRAIIRAKQSKTETLHMRSCSVGEFILSCWFNFLSILSAKCSLSDPNIHTHTFINHSSADKPKFLVAFISWRQKVLDGLKLACIPNELRRGENLIHLGSLPTPQNSKPLSHRWMVELAKWTEASSTTQDQQWQWTVAMPLKEDQTEEWGELGHCPARHPGAKCITMSNWHQYSGYT